MLEEKVKQFVYTVTDKSESALTLLSMLITVTFLIVTLPFLAYFIHTVTYTDHVDELCIQQFYIFLRDEFILATNHSVSKNKVTFYDLEGRKVSFEKYNNIILRKVDGQGHDIYLRDIQDVNFTDISYGVQVKITSLKGETYEKAIMYFK